MLSTRSDDFVFKACDESWSHDQIMVMSLEFEKPTLLTWKGSEEIAFLFAYTRWEITYDVPYHVLYKRIPTFISDLVEPPITVWFHTYLLSFHIYFGRCMYPRLIPLTRLVVSKKSGSLLITITVMSHDHHGVLNHRQLHCLVNRLFPCSSKKTPKLRATSPFVRGIYRPLVDSHHKGLVTRKAFPRDDVIMHVKYSRVSVQHGVIYYSTAYRSTTTNGEHTCCLYSTVWYITVQRTAQKRQMWNIHVFCTARCDILQYSVPLKKDKCGTYMFSVHQTRRSKNEKRRKS